MQEKYLLCVPGVDGKIHPSSFYAALRPRHGFSHSHQEHMKDTNIIYQNTGILILHYYIL